ncbi:MAG: hypothetical protein ACM3QU_15565 [Verrucomicrobiota bacterium]
MSAVGLFAIGAAVTLIVAFALGLCIWGAILDGRDERQRRLDEPEERGSLPPVSLPIRTTTSTANTIHPAA